MVPTPINYRCDLSDTRQRRVNVEMNVDLAQDRPLEVYLPQLSPGSTVASQNHPASLLRFSAHDQNGEPLLYEKLPEGGYRLPGDLKGPVKIRYSIKAEDFCDVQDQLTQEQAYLNGPATFMAVRGREHDTPATIAFENLPSDKWQSSSTLPRILNTPHTFYAANYDDIADDNVKLGDVHVATEKVGNTTIKVVQQGTGPYKNLKQPGATPEENAQDMARLYRAFLKNFGEFPNQRYTCTHARPDGVEADDNYVIHKHYLHSGPDMTDGLEHFHGHEMIRHANSESYIQSEFNGSARANESYTMAHEVSHKLLAKYVQHQDIDAHNLERPVATDGLWVSEGLTNWTGYLLERQTGLLSPEQYLKRWEGVIDTYYHDFAQNPTNARDDSMEAQLGNGKYYNKGSLCGLALDLELRHLSGGKASMLDVLRGVKEKFGGSGNYHKLEDIQAITRSVAAPYADGAEFVDKFFHDHLVDRKRIDLDKYLQHAGYSVTEQTDAWPAASVNIQGAVLSSDSSGQLSLKLDPKVTPPKEICNLKIPSLGFSLAPYFKTPWYVTEGGAADEAGLKFFQGKIPEQVLLRTAQGDVDLKAPKEVGAGQVEAMVFRFRDKSVFDGQERPVEIVVPTRKASQAVLAPLDKTTPEQLKLREEWLAQLPEDVLNGTAS